MKPIQIGMPYVDKARDITSDAVAKWNAKQERLALGGDDDEEVVIPEPPKRRTVETDEDYLADFGDNVLVTTTDHDVTVTLPDPATDEQSIIVVKDDDSPHVVHLVGTVNGVVDRDIFNANESLELLPTSDGYTII